MEIIYKTRKIQRICEDASVATRTHGERMALIIHQRVDELSAAPTVEMLVQYRIGGCHPLTGNRAGQYGMSLVHPYRLVFEKVTENAIEVRILEIVDYH